MDGVNPAVLSPSVQAPSGNAHVPAPRPRIGNAGEVRSGSSGPRSLVVAAPALAQAPTTWTGDPPAAIRLTQRETEVLRLLARRWTDKEIAAALGISPRTAMGHVAAVLAKLGVRNRREAAAVAGRVSC